jgi:hypothetical protein
MSAADETRRRLAQVLLAVGALLLLLGVFAHSGWRLLALSLGAMLLVFSAIIFASISVIDGVPWLVRLMSRLAEPVWDGELLHTDGSEYKIPYDFDEHGSPRFIARAVCAAVGMPPPAKDAARWGGVPLLREGKHAYFTEADVQAYLAPMAVENPAAARLLLLIRNNVLRRLEKRRDDERRYEQEQGDPAALPRASFPKEES